jgi:hypothetical protein
MKGFMMSAAYQLITTYVKMACIKQVPNACGTTALTPSLYQGLELLQCPLQPSFPPWHQLLTKHVDHSQQYLIRNILHATAPVVDLRQQSFISSRLAYAQDQCPQGNVSVLMILRMLAVTLSCCSLGSTRLL